MNDRHVWRACDGNIAVLTALLLPVIVLAAGIGLDSARRSFTQAKMQEAADAAALGSLRRFLNGDDTSDSEGFALNMIDAAGFGSADGAVPSVTLDPGSRKATVTIDLPLNTTLTNIIGVRTMPIQARAEALAAGNAMPVCVLALHPNDNATLAGSGGTDFDAANCRIQVNSSHSDAVVLTGGSSIDSGENCFVGGVQSGLALINPAPTPGCPPFPDPFNAMPKPPVGACDHTNYSGSGVVTLNPGVYCGGISFSGGATVTFNPGLYIVSGGDLAASGGGSFEGDGVTFFLTGAGAGVTLSGGTAVDFKAMSTGLLAGFVVYLDPGATPMAKSHISGGGDVHYEGVFYFPNQELVMSGTGAVSSPSAFVAYVADRFTYTGGSSLAVNYDEALTTVPIPPGLRPGSNPYLSR